ncbi:hypothetical protein MMPV_002175 [Pyropia vietnamensis]
MARMQVYSQEELGSLPPGSRLLFAHPPPSAVVVKAPVAASAGGNHAGSSSSSSGAGASDSRRGAAGPGNSTSRSGGGSCSSSRSRRHRIVQSVDAATLRSALAPVTCLRLSTDVAGYSVYPTTEAEVAVNAFLWRAVAANGFDGAEAAALFLRNVYVLAIPDYLYDFMRIVSMEQANEVVLFILSTIAEAESPEGLSIMEGELAPTFWDALVTHMTDRRRLGRDYQPPLEAFRRMMDGVLDHICSLSAWRAEVGIGFLTSSDMAALLDAARARRESHAGGGEERPAAVGGGGGKRGQPVPTKDAADAPADWTVWSDLLLVPSSPAASGGNSARAAALGAMADAICHDAQPAVVAATRAVILASRRPLVAAADATLSRARGKNPMTDVPAPNYLALVPADVLRCLVIPALAVASASLGGGGASAESGSNLPPTTTRTSDAASDGDTGALATAPMTARMVAAPAPARDAIDGDTAAADAVEAPTGGSGGEAAAGATANDGDGGDEPPPHPSAGTTAAATDDRPTFSLKVMLLEDEAMRSVFEGTDSDTYTDEDDHDTDEELDGGGAGWPAVGGGAAAIDSVDGGSAVGTSGGGTSSSAAPSGWEDDEQWVCVSDAETELYESESRGLAELVPLVGALPAGSS